MKLKPNYFWHNPVGIKKIKKSDGRLYSVRKSRERFFFPDEWMAFYDMLNKHENRISNQQLTFNLLLYTGARINEARNIKVQDVDLERNNIVLRITKKVITRPAFKRKDVTAAKIKGERRIRVVTISDKFAKFLKKAIKENDLKNENYLPVITKAGANKAMKIALRKAGIPDWQMFSVHNIRKTAEMWLLSIGMDSFKVVKRFGHSREVALKHYLSSDVFSFEEKQQIKEILGEL